LTRAVRWHVRFLAAPLFLSCTATLQADSASIVESYVSVPMPPGFKVVISELEGPIFADARGHTLYMWPSKKLRNGYSGEMKGKPACYDEVRKETAGLMSPYPAGVLLPDLATRPSCIKLWPPVLASGDAKPVGKWTILTRKDGTKQWAYDEQALYTSILDKEPGEAIGGSTRKDNEESPAVRVPVAPPPKIPPGFAVKTTSNGRLLTTDKNYSVYAYDKDTATESMCDSVCVRTWIPLIASQLAQAQGEWSTIERSAGLRQWTFRGKPLYTYVMDTNQWSQEGSDVPGWRNVYMQRVPPPPADFTVQDSVSGQVLADHRGMTIYRYNCGDDSVDQLSCDHPDDTQAYRLAMCGAGDAVRCAENWPYVPADSNAKSTSHAWTVMRIDPKTGRRAAAEQPGAVSVWAYRERPVYTYAGDRQPGDIDGDSAGEWRGYRNGFKAFWLRDDYYNGAL
jgi:predicted lipoprotein with Yx(FWY)xxD motif